MFILLHGHKNYPKLHCSLVGFDFQDYATQAADAVAVVDLMQPMQCGFTVWFWSQPAQNHSVVVYAIL